MKLYKIRNWNTLYENNRTRELKKLDWVPIPNKQDGDGYTAVMDHKEGAAIFGAWIACAQIASRCDPRGTLLRDGKKPHDSTSLSRMSRIPIKTIDLMLSMVSHPDINWLEVIELQTGCDNPACGCDNPACGCLEGKGREGKGKNGIEENGNLVVLKDWNPTPEMLRIGSLLKRRPTTVWTDKELKAYKKISAVDESDFKKLEAYYFAIWPADKDYRFRDLETLLNNWGKAIDRANNFKPGRCF